MSRERRGLYQALAIILFGMAGAGLIDPIPPGTPPEQAGRKFSRKSQMFAESSVQRSGPNR